MKKLSIITIVFLCGFVCVASAHAIAVEVDYVYSGLPGNYVFDFTVYNNIASPNPHSIYAWGVDVTSSGMSSPDGWYPGSSYNPTNSGGQDITYPTTWANPNLGLPEAIYPGNSLSGFTIDYSGLNIPETIRFVALAWDTAEYEPTEGDGSFRQFINNPGFQGIAEGSSVPEPATMLLFGSGLIGLVGFRRKLKK